MEIEVGGQIQGISLSSFLQIVHMDRTTCTLKIYSNDEIGYLYLEEGALVSAETGSLKNVEAAYEILSWNKTIIVIDNAPIPDRNIKIPLMSILMEGLRLKDEKIARMGEQSDLTKVPGMEREPDTSGSLDDKIASEFIAGPTGDDETPPPFPPLQEVETPLETPPESPAGDPLKGPEADVPPAQPIPERPGKKKKKAEKKEEETKKPRRRRLLLAALSLPLCAVAVLGFLYYHNASTLKKEYQAAVNQSRAQRDFASKKRVLQSYLNTREDNKYTADITSRLNELNLLIKIEKKIKAMPVDDAFLEKATAQYKAFLKGHPSSSFKGEVSKELNRLKRRMERQEFERLNQLGDLPPASRMKEYQAYLSQNPKGKHRQEVQNLIAAIGDEYYQALKKEWPRLTTQGNWEAGIQLADRFLDNFKEDKRREEVLELKQMMVDRTQFADMRFRAKVMTFRDAKKMYIDYLAKNPGSIIAGDVRKEIAAYNQKIDIQTRWEDISSYANNPDVPIEPRIRELKNFVTTNRTGLFEKESKELLTTLQTRRNAAIIAKAAAEKRRQELLRQKRLEDEKTRLLREKEEARLAKIRAAEREIRLKKEETRLTSQLAAKTGRFAKNGGRTVIDKNTGLTWCLLDSFIDANTCMNYDTARSYVKKLNTGGYKDWRLPTVSELALLYNGNPFYPHSGASWYWSSTTTTGAWGKNLRIGIFRPDMKDEFRNEFLPEESCGYVHAVRP